ncbi:probable LRR receptor-like protein kinase At1g51890 [Typha angustifolia]|uniref:probable LRR receptor-like protein kinase At1g51890 n=1 Tax=Typha angustifolia TaxID=59011 RepID=UPI003C2E26E1
MYGNYDGRNSVQKNSPLLFDLHIGIDRWTTVNISHPTNPFTYEAITRISANQRLSVCLIRTNSCSTPFISSLEMRPLKSTLYPIVSSFFDSIVLLMRRNLGASGDKIIRYPDDPYDRFWEPMNITLDVLTTDKTVEHNKTKEEYEVPSVVLQTASVSAGINDSVGFYWDTPDSNTDYYVILHFSELELLPEKDVRVFDFYSDGDHQLGTKHAPTFLENSAYTTWPAWYAFSLNASEGATRPPLLNAFEIYSIGETSYETTNVGDVEAMLAIKEAYKLKKNWVGDPCLPEKYAWDGVTCGIRANDFRVTAINLSATGLVGQVSNVFSRLTEIQSLDLSNNNLTGKVPDSVATISNLQVLNLTGNCIEVPDALIEKTKDSSLILLRPVQTTYSFAGDISAIVNARLQGMLNTESVWKVTELAMRCSCTLIRDQKMSEVVIHLRESLEREIAERSTSTTAESQDYADRSSQREDYADRSSQREDYADRSFQREDYADSQLQFRTRKFTYKELEIITKNFEREIGRGGFGTVYHGLLEDGTEVAVKIMRRTESLESFDSFEKYYLNEAQILLKVHHRNLISLAGYCKDRDGIAIVYEYMPQGCYKQVLDKSASALSWAERLQIAIDVAQGLDYLHNTCPETIIHRNVKTSTILLGKNLEAKLSNFQIAKLFDSDLETELFSVVCGTLGYMDPEYMVHGRFSRKTDVYSFGVVLLEIITARPAMGRLAEAASVHIAQHMASCIAGGASVDDIADPLLQGEYDADSVWIVIDLAMRCTSEASIERPTIAEVLIHLRDSLAIETARKMSKNLYSESESTNSSPNMTASTITLGTASERIKKLYSERTNSSCSTTTSTVTPKAASERSKKVYSESTHNKRAATVTAEASFERSSDSCQSNVDNQDANPPFVNHQSSVDHEDRRLPFESHQFTYAELEGITKKFAQALGGGGFGTVFYGSLENGTKVAVKKLSPSSEQGSNEFLAEVSSLSQVRHRNLVSLVGYCNDITCLALVYEYMPQGSLEDHLIGRASIGRALSWAERLQIALDAARGLDYLHNGLPEPIIHRDVKTSNILLSQNLEAKVSDFGLSKSFDRNLRTHVSADLAFTPGYLDPECCNLWRFSEKTDVYSFGVVLLEIITGEPPISRLGEVVHIVQRVEVSLMRGNIHDIADARLQGEYDVRSVWKVVDLAMGCTTRTSIQRPTMTEIVVQLRECLTLETVRASSRNTDNGSTDSTEFVTASAT